MSKQGNKTPEQQTGVAKIKDWILHHFHLLLVIGGVLLIVLSMKTQTVLITDAENQEYTIQLQYSVFGYCVTAAPMTKSAQPIAADYMFLLDSTDESVTKAAEWIAQKTGGGVEVYVNGYPRNSDKLTAHLVGMLEEQGIQAKKMETE